MQTLPGHKKRLAAAAANNFPARRHYWQRALPIMSPFAADEPASSFHLLCYVLPPRLLRPDSLFEVTS